MTQGIIRAGQVWGIYPGGSPLVTGMRGHIDPLFQLALTHCHWPLFLDSLYLTPINPFLNNAQPIFDDLLPNNQFFDNKLSKFSISFRNFCLKCFWWSSHWMAPLSEKISGTERPLGELLSEPELSPGVVRAPLSLPSWVSPGMYPLSPGIYRHMASMVRENVVFVKDSV